MLYNLIFFQQLINKITANSKLSLCFNLRLITFDKKKQIELTFLLSPSTSFVEDTVVLSKSEKISDRSQNELLKNVSDTYKTSSNRKNTT